MVKETLFYQRLAEQIRLSNKSVNCVERELGYARNALHNYKLGQMPSGERLIELANYFNIDPEYLIGKNPKNEKGLEELFSRLTDTQKLELVNLCRHWLFIQANLLNIELAFNNSQTKNLE